MKQRKILLIHGLLMTTLLKKYILAELTDVQLTIIDSANDAIKKIHNANYDVIICGKEYLFENDKELIRKIETDSENSIIIALTSTETQSNIQELQDNGIHHFLVSPFKATDLAQKINLVCNPRNWRKLERVHFPKINATVKIGDKFLTAKIVNISQEGILCDFDYNSDIDIMDVAIISIQFPEEYDNLKIENIRAKYSRSNAHTWTEDFKPQLMRIVWRFLEIDSENEAKLIDVLKNENNNN